MLDFLAVGIGQCGNKFADEFAGFKTKAIAVNTTDKDMSKLANIDKQNLVNISINNNGGAGKTPEIGQVSMLQNLETVCSRIEAVGKDSDYIILWAGLGGGTGSGGLPVLAKELKKREKNIIIGMTLPDASEGFEVKINAIKACINILKFTEKKRIPFLIVDNNKVMENLNSASGVDRNEINKKIVRTITQFNKYANQASEYATFDETDYRKTLTAPGMIIVNKIVLPSNEIHTVDTIRDAVMDKWKNLNFYTDCDIETARMFTTIAIAPSKWLNNKSNLKLIENAFIDLRNECGTVSPYTGIYSNASNDEVVIYTMLTGLKAPMQRLIKLQEDAIKENQAIQQKEQANKIDFGAFDMDALEQNKKNNLDDVSLEIDGQFDADDMEDEDDDCDATLALLKKQGLIR